MNCCQCQGIEDLFNEKAVSKELEQYRQKGPDKTTRMMTGAFKAEEIRGCSLLDIGGGIGAVQHELLDAGMSSALDVDASQAYITAARREAQRRGLSDRTRFFHGNFVDLAPSIEPADVVTLNRVICCYPDMEKLVDLSAARAKKLYSLVYPRDMWWVRLGVAVINYFMGLRKSAFRTFVHPSRQVEAIIHRHGFTRRFYQQTLVWQVVVYARG